MQHEQQIEEILTQTFEVNSQAKQRSSTASFDSDKSSSTQSQIQEMEGHPSIRTVFKCQSSIELLSSKVTHKGVIWLLTIAWAKNYSLQSSWTALLLFYGYRLHQAINKTHLQSIMLICLQLATKVHEVTPLTTNQLLMCCNQPTSRQYLSIIEYKILQLFDYNLYIPHTLQAVYNINDPQTTMKVLFLAEIYLTKDHTIFFDSNKMKQLVLFVTDGQTSESFDSQIQDLREMVFKSSNKILHHKFSTQIDLELFLLKLQ